MSRWWIFLAIAVSLSSTVAAAAGPDRGDLHTAPVVEFVVEKRGAIRVALMPVEAPKTVRHFLSLVGRKFYDGVLFHRMEPKQLVQGGDPESRKVDGSKIAKIPPAEVTQRYGLGTHGSGETVPLEAEAICLRGTLGLARSVDPNSGDSQFFFNLADNHRLDNQYTVFGRVVAGLDVMDRIEQGDRIRSIRLVRQPARPRRRGPTAR